MITKQEQLMAVYIYNGRPYESLDDAIEAGFLAALQPFAGMLKVFSIKHLIQAVRMPETRQGLRTVLDLMDSEGITG